MPSHAPSHAHGVTPDLFTSAQARNITDRPLADRMRPRTLEDVVGQPHLLGEGGLLRRLIRSGSDHVPSMILWGPPGTGKTTLAQCIARQVHMTCESVSAVMAGVKDLRAIIDAATQRKAYHGQRTLIFVDEIHRFNKAQQDALLPHVESGLLTLIGATTENPSFAVNGALLSRCRVVVLHALQDGAVEQILRHALMDRERGLGKNDFTADGDALAAIVAHSHGDARYALTTLELVSDVCLAEGARHITIAHVEQASQKKAMMYDRHGDAHYHVISAFIKSMRGSDPTASVYWLARMLEAGEDPRFVLRRLVIFASEDIGNADPQALQVAVSALHAFELVGMPEGVLPITQAVTYLACAPKSNAALTAYNAAKDDVLQHGPLPVPPHLCNAVGALGKSLGHGVGYKYPHDFKGGCVEEIYMPKGLEQRRYYPSK